ncbi:MAG TPA: S-layer homology domain-containing protein [Clostridiales bacterium]|nr:S-layer homology domain-containing protein [Clostridiales bacterium]
MSKKFLSVFLALVMAFALFPITGAAEGDVPEFSDMPVGGAGEALQFAVDNGLLNGYDGKIMPYDPLTRAQMAAIMARAFGATEKADVSGYTDLVGVDEWIVDSMAKALKMGIMQGYDNKMDPNGYITREQAFVVLARALKLEPSATSRKWYSDADELSEWAKGYVFTLVNAGYITGTGDTLNPKDYITRADFAQLMYNTVKQFINVPGEYTKVADGNVVVNVPDVTLKNVTIKGDLIVGDGVGEGDLTLDNVVVKGRMLVRGGGIESIVIVGGGVEGKVIVAKADGNVRVVVDGADVEVVVIDDGKNEVVIEGTVGAVDINASDVPVAIRGGKVGEVKVSCEGSAVITVADDAEVGSIAVADSAEGTSIFVKGSVAEIETSAANTMVYGSGEVGTVSVGSTADNTSVTTPNTVINNGGASGVTAAGGKEVPVVGSVQNNATGTNIVTSPAPSDGGETGTTPTPTPTPQPQPIPQVPAGPVVVPVYGVRIEGTPELRQVLTAVVNPSSATVKYQWLRSDDGVNFEEIEGATGRTYTLTESDLGMYIQVKVTGILPYFGTVQSAPVYLEKIIELVPAIGEGSYHKGQSFTSTVTLRSNYDIPEGLTTTVTLTDKSGAPVYLSTLLEYISLTTQVGDKEPSKTFLPPLNLSTFSYGGADGFGLFASEPQVTTIEGRVKLDAPVGTYIITTETKYQGETVATAVYTVHIEPVAEVANITDLNAALQIEDVQTIVFLNDIISEDSPVEVRRTVTIDGNNKTLSFTGLFNNSNNVNDGLVIHSSNTVVKNRQ